MTTTYEPNMVLSTEQYDVDYEVLPHVLTAEEAMRDDAPILHERLLTLNSVARRAGAWGDGDEGSNVSNRFEFRLGDVEAGFEEAAEDAKRQLIERATIANAIHDATGVRMTKLPMSPGAVVEALGNYR